MAYFIYWCHQLKLEKHWIFQLIKLFTFCMQWIFKKINCYLCLWLEFQIIMYFFMLDIFTSQIFYEIFWGKGFFSLNKTNNQLWCTTSPLFLEISLRILVFTFIFSPLSLVYSWIVFFFPSISPFSILGPLTKKQTDDLGDNDGAEDEGIFFHQIYLHDKGLNHFFHPFLFFYFLSFFEELFLIPVFDVFCLLACCYI